MPSFLYPTPKLNIKLQYIHMYIHIYLRIKNKIRYRCLRAIVKSSQQKIYGHIRFKTYVYIYLFILFSLFVYLLIHLYVLTHIGIQTQKHYNSGGQSLTAKTKCVNYLKYLWCYLWERQAYAD